MENWEYIGDIDIECGGTYFNMSTFNDGYVDALRITNLGSAIGFNGAIMIEKIVVNGTTDKERIKQAIDDGYPDDHKITDLDIVFDLMQYGHYDMGWDCYSEDIETIQTEKDNPMEFDGWEAEKVIKLEDLKSYVESKL